MNAINDGQTGAALLAHAAEAVSAAEHLHDASRAAVAARVVVGGRLDPARLDADQTAAHGIAWQATYVEALRQTLAWARELAAADAFRPTERAILRLGFAEYLAQLSGGIAISQTETIRPADLFTPADAIARFADDAAIRRLTDPTDLPALRAIVAQACVEGDHGAVPLDDPDLDALRETFTRFAAAEIAPHAQDWHATDSLIPLDLIGRLADMGVFGATIPEEHGGLGLGKIAMCLISEALSEGYIGVGSLGTRSEIAGELIRAAGTPDQKTRYLPGLADGTILSTAVFTEPNTGSDLGALRTRAVRDGDVYRVFGAKTWITHGSRSDLMTLMVRTDPATTDYRGLSMLLAAKPRGTDADPFPAAGMSGSDIGVLGYRGMREYEIAFDGFEVPVSALLGGVEGQGFRQLMETFESARIQTAARALGVGRNAIALAADYAATRVQFGRPLARFPRVQAKMAWMVTETMLARLLTYFAARRKDAGHRCDIEAGMAKLLAARVAFANADTALQIHGGNGYATEYPISRVFCDARILSIFEGAAEIQAHVIARGLLSNYK